MNRTLFQSFVKLSLLMVVAVSSAQGQFGRTMVFHVPFDFDVGNKTLPAGDYRIEPFGTGDQIGSMLLIRSRTNSLRAVIHTQGIEVPNSPTEPTLVFNRYGERYFLRQIWMRGDPVGRKTSVPTDERDLLSRGLQTQTVALLGTRR